ncbi:glucose 1-dehydrogenase [Edaphobacter sp. 12200R-103]|uniref:glucose 1-dehydrogenase n=1 Tax=Edaphobacter sp. 12200R-103 TaxID=2703788 RepID=UPI00138BBC28|nr:glucose 1-dehydrogenase [Edaphobacter sp. 12200R-103]QHS51888.1 glucose 1-dehydrogenase [Edaphobacter sp. 12200R-103]
MSKLSGKVAVVTGASKGIGADIAKGLAREGASVVVNYAASKEGAEKVVSEITQAGGNAFAVQGDVAKEADVNRLFEETRKAFGKLDVLVNNAGVYQFSPIEEFSPELYSRLFNTNVLGTLLATREAVKLFGDNGGSIINIGSAVTELHPPTSAVYTGTKGAIDSITAVLSKELGPRKIRVNALNPGMIETEGVHSAGFIGSDFQKSIEVEAPLGRIGQPNDVTPVAVFLASDDSGWVTGETIVASGGHR